jgi:plasmid stabilization system protein ParE
VLYKVKIDQEALLDIQEIIEWYNEQAQGIGARFFKQITSQINALKKAPFVYANRYEDVRCMIIKKFPFMVHYMIDSSQKTIVIFAIFHTSRNPKIWEERKIRN